MKAWTKVKNERLHVIPVKSMADRGERLHMLHGGFQLSLLGQLEQRSIALIDMMGRGQNNYAEGHGWRKPFGGPAGVTYVLYKWNIRTKKAEQKGDAHNEWVKEQWLAGNEDAGQIQQPPRAKSTFRILQKQAAVRINKDLIRHIFEELSK